MARDPQKTSHEANRFDVQESEGLKGCVPLGSSKCLQLLAVWLFHCSLYADLLAERGTLTTPWVPRWTAFGISPTSGCRVWWAQTDLRALYNCTGSLNHFCVTALSATPHSLQHWSNYFITPRSLWFEAFAVFTRIVPRLDSWWTTHWEELPSLFVNLWTLLLLVVPSEKLRTWA